MRRIGVFCGSSVGRRPRYRTEAEALGRALATRRIGLVYGGARVGLMGALADATLAAGGEVIGVIPRALVAKEVAHNGLTELRVVSSMHERKATMVDLADGFIALPGGWGTLEELFEVLTWAQLGLHRKPCGLLNVEEYFRGLLAFCDDPGPISHEVVEDDAQVLGSRPFVSGTSPSTRPGTRAPTRDGVPSTSVLRGPGSIRGRVPQRRAHATARALTGGARRRSWRGTRAPADPTLAGWEVLCVVTGEPEVCGRGAPAVPSVSRR